MRKEQLTARLMEIITELDNGCLDSVNEIDWLIGAKYANLFVVAIEEGWTESGLTCFDIVKQIDSPETANILIGAFDDEIYDFFYSCEAAMEANIIIK